jgi:hypothetical protein
MLVVACLLACACDAHAQSEGGFIRRRPGRPAPAPAQPGQPASRDGTPGTEAAPTAERPPRPEPYVPAPALVPMPDRWRIVETLGMTERWWDPYAQNTLKGDKPVFGEDWFVSLRFVSDTLFEARRLPVPRGLPSTGEPGDLDVFGDGDQIIVNQNFILETALIQGNTTFRPPDWEFRVTGVGNVNYLDVEEVGIVNVDPEDGTERTDGHFGFQELFVDRHLWNVSDAYDFDSLRVGIQPFTTDFRGFLFEDSQPGVRLFGTRARNRLQYNVAWFRRLEKNTNSGLNTVFEPRTDDVIAATVFYQDFPVLGFTSQALAVYNRNREGDARPHFNDNGFLERPASIGDERPHDYDVVYLGAGGDGRLGWLNLTTNAFLAVGEDDHNAIAQRRTDILAYLVAAEASIDVDWTRWKAYGYHASGDDDPFDDTAEGFDAIFENPNFAGAETSFWHRQPIPLVAGGEVVLSGRNALLPALRSSKEEGQSNFVNPGLFLFGVGGDLDVLPQLRLTFNATRLDFDDTAVLRTTRQQRSVSSHIGYDLSGALLYRPWFIENVVLRLSGAVLLPGSGLDDLYDERYDVFYSTLLNVLLTY